MGHFDRRHLRLHLVKTQGNSINHVPTYSPLRNESNCAEKQSTLREWLSWRGFKADLLAWSSSGDNDRKENCWKPATLGGPVLGVFVLVSIGIITVLEILIRTSLLKGNDGGVIFAQSKETITMTTRFCYLYLPTIIAVLLSMLWSWIDLDTKRLEPWFQLSRPGGARGSDSLLLQYPFDFLPFIPITALRRRHWNVFFSGTVILVIFWVITPLQSAIFNTGIVTRERTVALHTTAEVTPLESHQNMLNSNFLNSAYGISSLGQKPPPFTTADFALLPFKPTVNPKDTKSDAQTWSAKAKIYSTSFDCEPAVHTVKNNTGFLEHTLANSRGCSTRFGYGMINDELLVLYLGWFDDAVIARSIGNENCTSEHKDTFLAVWAEPTTERLLNFDTITALFCRPKYLVQEAMVTVNASDGRVTSHTPMGTSKQLPNPNKIFNTTHFEYIVSTGVPPIKQRADRPDTFRLEPYPSMAKYNLSWPMTNAVGFGVSLSEATTQELKDPKILHRAFENAHRLLFAVAFSMVIRPLSERSSETAQTGVIHDTLGAITVDRTIARIVQVAFGLVIVMTLLLWFLTSHRPSHLTKDPSTISDIMSLTRDVDTGNDLEDISNRNFQLQRMGSKHAGGVCLVGDTLHNFSSSSSLKDSKTSINESADHVPPIIRPLELRVGFGLLFTSVILAALCAVVFLDLYSSARNGIALPSTNTTVISIIENYLPTIFATLLEPAWIILNRILCLLQPFDELRAGNARPTVSILAKYTSLPPQLNVWRALRSGHFVLALVCIIVVSTNLLAVVLSVLIEQRSTAVTFPMTGSQTILPRFDGGPLTRDIALATYLDHFYAAQSNISSGTSLPPWIDTQRFYVPFEFENPRIETAAGIPLGLQGILGSTTGFGVDLDCHELSLDQKADISFTLSPSNVSDAIIFKSSYLLPNGSRMDCRIGQTRSDEKGFKTEIADLTSASSAIELMGHNVPDTEFCAERITVGWIHVGANNSIHSSAKTSFDNRTLSHTFFTCMPRLQIATFDVLVATDGRVLSSTQSSNFTPTADYAQYFRDPNSKDPLFDSRGKEYLPEIKNERSLIDAIGVLTFKIGDEAGSWHNDTFTTDWMNSLIKYRMGNDAVVNPDSPVLTYEQGSALFSEVYKTVFALLLGLNQHAFEMAPVKITKEVTLIATEQRIFLEPTMFKLTVVLLSLQLIVAILYYVYRPKQFLTSMPTSIASIIAYVAHSRALDDFKDESVNEKDDGERRYGYGRFLGTDGKTHIGIEKSRWVVPLESENPAVRRGKWWDGLRMRRKKREGDVKVWI